MYRRMIWFVCVVLLSLSMIACSEKKEAAAPSAVPLQVFRQEITSPAPLQTLKVNEKATMKVTVKNIGNEPWPCKGIDAQGAVANRVGLGFHWLDNTGKIVEPQGRALLPNDLMPGTSVTLEAIVQAPPKPGDYSLRFSMVQEQVAWFYDKGAEPLIIKVKVKP
jgi:hypothetical protein